MRVRELVEQIELCGGDMEVVVEDVSQSRHWYSCTGGRHLTNLRAPTVRVVNCYGYGGNVVVLTPTEGAVR